MGLSHPLLSDFVSSGVRSLKFLRLAAEIAEFVVVGRKLSRLFTTEAAEVLTGTAAGLTSSLSLRSADAALALALPRALSPANSPSSFRGSCCAAASACVSALAGDS